MTHQKKFYIVKKLDAQEDAQVSDISSKIREVAFTHGIIEVFNENDCDENTFIFSCGGDGTMLYSCKIAERTRSLVYGIALGNLGFLTSFNKALVLEHCDILFGDDLSLYRDTFKHQARWLIKVDGTDHTALNDFIIAPKGSEGTITYDIWIDDRSGENYVGEHTANNLVISTPTGSTAYSLNAGGSILSPELQLMQVLHVCPASFSSRPLVIDGNSRIRVKVNKCRHNPLIIRADGQTVLTDVYDFVITSAFKSAMILPKEWKFYSVLRNKLGWNKHFI